MFEKKIDNFGDLFCHELSDLRNAEMQLTKALPKMARAASSPELKAGFEQHLRETERQLATLDGIFESLGWEAEKITCEAMKGLIKEGDDAVEEFQAGPLLDVALIIAAQKIEHYEISGYGSACALGEKLGLSDVVQKLRVIEEQEAATDKKLTAAAMKINEQAASYAEAAE